MAAAVAAGQCCPGWQKHLIVPLPNGTLKSRRCKWGTRVVWADFLPRTLDVADFAVFRDLRRIHFPQDLDFSM